MLSEYIEQLEEEKEKAYWQGYIAKQNEAMEICKQCKYIKKARQLESDKQKLIEKLEEAIEFARIGSCPTNYAIVKCLENVLKILKGEKDERNKL